MVIRVECPECGLTYTAESFEQLETIPSHPKKFWNYYRCTCGYIFEAEQWWFHPLEEMQRANSKQYDIMLSELFELIKIRKSLLWRGRCEGCPTFPSTNPVDEGAHAELEQERVSDIKESCALSLSLTSLLSNLTRDLLDIFSPEVIIQPYPELITILKEFKANLEAFKYSKHQDEGGNEPTP